MQLGEPPGWKTILHVYFWYSFIFAYVWYYAGWVTWIIKCCQRNSQERTFLDVCLFAITVSASFAELTKTRKQSSKMHAACLPTVGALVAIRCQYQWKGLYSEVQWTSLDRSPVMATSRRWPGPGSGGGPHIPCLEGRDWGQGGALYSAVQCIMGNDHMTPPRPEQTDSDRQNITFSQLHWWVVKMCNIGLTHGIAQRLILHFDSTFGCHKLVLLSSYCHLICQLIQRVHGGTLIDSSSISALQIVIFPNLLHKGK